MKVKLSTRPASPTDFPEVTFSERGEYALGPGDTSCPFAAVDADFGDGTSLEVAIIPQPDGTVRVVVTGDSDVDFEVLDER